MQLNKYIAQCGAASRRKSVTLIRSGRVKVNGTVVLNPGHRVDPENDSVRLDGKAVALPRRFRTILMNKPAGLLTTVEDDRSRPTVMDRLDVEERLFPVGRLDMDTTGVLLLTNDGELAHRLAHPRYAIEKTYEVRVGNPVDSKIIQTLKDGVDIGGGTRVSGEARILEQSGSLTTVEIRIHEGKKRQVKRMFKAAGHPVIRLRRTCFAGLRTGSLREGGWRDLTENEIKGLKRMTGLSDDEKQHE